MATPEILEQRVAALEREIIRLKAESHLRPTATPPNFESRGARLIREAEAGRAEFVTGWGKFVTELGISCEPVGAKKLRETLVADGLDPNDNSASRELIAMREE